MKKVLCLGLVVLVACSDPESSNKISELQDQGGLSPSDMQPLLDAAPDASSIPDASISADASSMEDASADIDASADNHCQSCIPEGGIPRLEEQEIIELSGPNEVSTCQGVCIAQSEGPGKCFFPEEPGVECDQRELGLASLTADPEIASEGYCVINGSNSARPVYSEIHTCTSPQSGAQSAWCDDCLCDETHCAGVGAPFPEKKTRVYVKKGGPTREELFVFLGGSGGRCSSLKWIGTSAAAAGYRSLCLSYVNDPTIANYCGRESFGDLTSTCEYDVRMENITGEDLSDKLIIGKHNSIETRLLKSLQTIHSSRPNAGFDQYFDGDTILWDRIIVGGFSQGGGNAGLLSVHHKLARSIFFSKGVSAILDGDLNTKCSSDSECQAAGWEYCAADNGVCLTSHLESYVTDMERKTAPEDSFLFIHEKEDAMRYSLKGAAAWGMDLCGDRQNVDQRSPEEFQCSRILTTSVEPHNNAGYHGSMGSDGAMARDIKGYPVNQQAILYMMLAE